WESKRASHGKLLKLLREVLREPTFPESEFLILKDEFKQDLEIAQLEPRSLASNTLTRLLNPHPNTSIHYVPTFTESLKRVANVKREDVAKLYQQQIGGAVGELVILGDFDADATQKELEAIFADWKTAVPYRRIPSVLVEGVKGTRQSLEVPD